MFLSFCIYSYSCITSWWWPMSSVETCFRLIVLFAYCVLITVGNWYRYYILTRNPYLRILGCFRVAFVVVRDRVWNITLRNLRNSLRCYSSFLDLKTFLLHYTLSEHIINSAIVCKNLYSSNNSVHAETNVIRGWRPGNMDIVWKLPGFESSPFKG
jgi:hypothetical protein